MGKPYDIAILGGGPGGYACAIRAAQLGASVALVEKDELGGTCLHRGCIPITILMQGVHFLVQNRKAHDFGIITSEPSLDFQKMMENKRAIIKRLTDGLKSLFKTHRIDFYYGHGRLKSSQSLEVENKEGPITIEGKRLVVATGSSSKSLPTLKPDGKHILTSEEALSMEEAPESLLIIGGGILGCQLACIYQQFGSKVTQVEMLPQILPGMDRDCANALKRELTKQGAEVLTSTKIESVEAKEGRVRALLSDGKEIVTQKAFLCIGRSFNTQGVGLEEAGIELDAQGAIKVDDKLRTSQPNISSIGDVNGISLFAHVAHAHGIFVAEDAFGEDDSSKHRISHEAFPIVVLANPEMASTGMSEAQAREKGLAVKVGKFPFAANGRAHCLGDTTGFVKVITDAESSKLLGATVIGPQASELIHLLSFNLWSETSFEKMAQLAAVHPSLNEALHEAILAVNKRAIHSL